MKKCNKVYTVWRASNGGAFASPYAGEDYIPAFLRHSGVSGWVKVADVRAFTKGEAIRRALAPDDTQVLRRFIGDR